MSRLLIYDMIIFWFGIRLYIILNLKRFIVPRAREVLFFFVRIRVVRGGTRLIVNFRGENTCWLKISGARNEKLDLLHFWSALKVCKVGLYRAFDCAFRFARKKRSVFPVVLPSNKPRVKDSSLDIFLRPF